LAIATDVYERHKAEVKKAAIYQEWEDEEQKEKDAINKILGKIKS
jgi:hypothetical protein